MSEKDRWSRPPLWRRLGPAERAIAFVIAGVIAAGLLLIADGLYMKARAGIVTSGQIEHGPASATQAIRRV